MLFRSVPYYDYPIDAGDSISLYKERDDREFVMQKVLDDLNYAVENCYADKKYFITKYVALALKSRICLFEGTFRKYHPRNPSTNQPWKDAHGSTAFLREAANASEDLMDSGK